MSTNDTTINIILNWPLRKNIEAGCEVVANRKTKKKAINPYNLISRKEESNRKGKQNRVN